MSVEKYEFDLQGLLAMSQRLVNQGASCSDVTIRLHEDGVSIVDSVEVVSDLYGIDMTTGKKIVFSHPIWGLVAEDAAGLHEALLQELKSQGKFSEEAGAVTVTVKL
jgi:hydrogenase maturation factor